MKSQTASKEEEETLWAIAEKCNVTGKDASFEEENEDEPVVCIKLGLFEDEGKAEKKAAALNKEWDDERFEVVGININK